MKKKDKVQKIKGLLNGQLTLEDLADPVTALFMVNNGVYTLKGGMGLENHIGREFSEKDYRQILRPKDRAILFKKKTSEKPKEAESE